jgi:hypothetical protein
VFHLSSTTGVTEEGIFSSELVRFSGFDNVGAPGDRTSVSRSTEPTSVPEPSTFWLFGAALLGAAYWVRRPVESRERSSRIEV